MGRWELTPNGSRLQEEFGCDYDPSPDGTDEIEWVRSIADYLDAVLKDSPRS